MIKRFIAVSIFFSFLISTSFAQVQGEKKVLFVGNSYTYFWNLPQQFNLMAEAKNQDYFAIQSTAGGANWSQHWRGEKRLKTKSIIADENFDIVVLQNHSLATIERADSMMLYGQKFSDLITKNGAEVYLYMTWSREWDPFMIETIAKKYAELGRKINATVVPVGLAWQKARESRPDFPLYFDDGSHQSALGTYLTACVFYKSITNDSSVGIPNRLIGADENGEKVYFNILTKEDALFCQKVADATVSAWNAKTLSEK